jgi:uncharacterized protein YbjT (DUF2867 family)
VTGTRDLAAATTAVFANPGHDGRTYAITGPEAVSFGDVAEAIGNASGNPVRHVDGTLAEHREYMQAPNRPAGYVNRAPDQTACAHLPRLRRGDVVGVRHHAAARSRVLDVPVIGQTARARA